MTVLFADVVHSMDLAAAVGAERLREIMAELFDRARRRWCSASAGRWTSSPATGSWRCSARRLRWRTMLFALVWPHWSSKKEPARLGADVERRDGVALQLRVGLNSGEVIAGEIGSGARVTRPWASRSDWPSGWSPSRRPGGVMLSESTARLVDGQRCLASRSSYGSRAPTRAGGGPPPGGDRGSGRGAPAAVSAHRTSVGVVDGRRNVGPVDRRQGPRRRAGRSARYRQEPHGVRGHSPMAAERGFEVFTALCESHTSELPFYVVTRLLRGHLRVGRPGRLTRCGRAFDQRLPDADPEDLLLLDDLLGIRDGETPLPVIDPDARRRRLTSLLNTAAPPGRHLPST